MRRCSSTSKKTPFLHVKDALLGARKASSQTLHITSWLHVDYKLSLKRRYITLKKMFSTLLCNDFLQLDRYSRDVEWIQKCLYDDSHKCSRMPSPIAELRWFFHISTRSKRMLRIVWKTIKKSTEHYRRQTA